MRFFARRLWIVSAYHWVCNNFVTFCLATEWTSGTFNVTQAQNYANLGEAPLLLSITLIKRVNRRAGSETRLILYDLWIKAQ
ncbi:hypothetical protein J3A83DRAFT_4249176 [Scleroderma citrinum]